MVSIPEIVLSSSSLFMPIIGLGTAAVGAGPDATRSAVLEAIKLGYRHFDTAFLYGSEKPLGEAIAQALRLGLINSRDELFITTKLWCDSAERHLVVPAIKKSLENLGLEYVDLYLIHWPLKLNEKVSGMLVPNECIIRNPSECVARIDIEGVWEGMEECRNLGLTKAIGVSNFSSKRLQHILSFAKIPPAVNQVEMNPAWQQKELNDFCKANGILLTAYSPLGAVGTIWGDNRVMQNNVLHEISKSKGKTIAQVSMRWLYEQGVSIVVKSFNIERMKENIDIFDWSLTDEELSKISQIPQRKGVYTIGVLTKEHNDILAEIDAEI